MSPADYYESEANIPKLKKKGKKIYEKSGAHPLSCADACEAKDLGAAELLSTLAQKQWQNGATERNRNRFRLTLRRWPRCYALGN